jgi:DNA-binding transcriptional MerR regulator
VVFSIYSISEVSNLTGISAYTLRYYEKIGVIPKPKRLSGKKEGIRRYNDRDLRFIQFVHGLKQTGMKLRDIASFVEEGCFVSINKPDMEVESIFLKRVKMLDKHIKKLEHQLIQLEEVKALAQDKRNFYYNLLRENGNGDAING